MNASPETVAAFEAWKLAELATYYADPCPDEVMDQLVDLSHAAFNALQSAPAVTADDMILKIFPIVLAEFEPRLGEPPLRFSVTDQPNYDDAFCARLIADFSNVSLQIRDALDVPAQPDRARA